MTTEQEAVSVANEPFICFGVPDVPFSKIQVPLSDEWIAEAVRIAGVLRDQYLAAFGEHGAQPFPDVEHVPLGEEFAPSAPPASAPPTNRPAAAHRPGTGLFCPDHTRVELVLSKDEYQPKDDSGQILRDKFFCPAKENGTGKNHNVWRSQALTPQAV